MRLTILFLLSFNIGFTQEIDTEHIKNMARIVHDHSNKYETDLYVGNEKIVNIYIDMMKDEKEALWWITVIQFVGYMSYPNSTIEKQLIDYLESPNPFGFKPKKESGEVVVLERYDYEPKIRTIDALGMLVQNSKDKKNEEVSGRIKSYLKECRNPDFWKIHLKWKPRTNYPDEKELFDSLSNRCGVYSRNF